MRHTFMMYRKALGAVLFWTLLQSQEKKHHANDKLCLYVDTTKVSENNA